MVLLLACFVVLVIVGAVIAGKIVTLVVVSVALTIGAVMSAHQRHR